jgi:hypothetical protein
MFEKKKNKINRETAVDSFEQFCDDWYISTDTSGMNEEDEAAFEKVKQQILTAIMDGRLIYNEDQTFFYTISGSLSKDLVGQVLTVKRPMGDGYMEMDKYKDGKNIKKMYSLLGSMISHGVPFIVRLDGIDLKILQAVQTLFLQG